MNEKYNGQKEIPDEVIKKQFEQVDEVSISARRFNHLQWRSIGIGNLGWWIPLTRVLPLIGITPTMLRPVFNPQYVLKRFNRWSELFGGKFGKLRMIKTELPKKISTYEKLGSFPLAEKPLIELAKILGKSVKVLREDGGTGDHYHIFTAHPDGTISEPETKVA